MAKAARVAIRQDRNGELKRVAPGRRFGVVVVVAITLKMARKPVKLQKENPAGCAGEGKQSKGN